MTPRRPHRNNRYIITQAEANMLAREIRDNYTELDSEAFRQGLPLNKPLTRGQIKNAVRRIIAAQVNSDSEAAAMDDLLRLLTRRQPDR